MSKSIQALFVGIDAHQETLAVAVLPESAVEPEPVRTIVNEPSKVRAYFRTLTRRGPIRAVYEAGCLGFVLQRLLTSLGVECMVAAPSRIPTLPGDHRKTDRLDAARLAVFLRGSQLTAVTPPSPQDEALRSLVRTRQAAQEDLVRARHRLQKFLLHRGHVWRGGSNWTKKHLAWIGEQRFDLEDDSFTLGYLRTELDLRITSLEALDARIAQRVQAPDVVEKVVALRTFRGVGDLTALCTIAELGDPKRFKHAEQVASYCGLVPSEHSSGKRVHRGAITRSGNKRLRRLLVESSQHYARSPGKSRAREARRAQAPPPIVDLARHAEQRLALRYRTLAFRKHTNQAKTAVARELIGFLWQALLRAEAT